MFEEQILRARFDGGCVPNPEGHASCACLIMRGTAEVYRKSVYLDEGPGMTNNVAEYSGLKLILEFLLVHPEPCIIIGDAELVINRMRSSTTSGGTGVCAPLALECKALARKLTSLVDYRWQPRTRNEVCDAMCQAEIDERRWL